MPRVPGALAAFWQLVESSVDLVTIPNNSTFGSLARLGHPTLGDKLVECRGRDAQIFGRVVASEASWPGVDRALVHVTINSTCIFICPRDLRVRALENNVRTLEKSLIDPAFVTEKYALDQGLVIGFIHLPHFFVFTCRFRLFAHLIISDSESAHF